jgi:hypothetical protein
VEDKGNPARDGIFNVVLPKCLEHILIVHTVNFTGGDPAVQLLVNNCIVAKIPGDDNFETFVVRP